MRMGFQFVKSPAIDGGDVPASRAERRRNDFAVIADIRYFGGCRLAAVARKDPLSYQIAGRGPESQNRQEEESPAHPYT